MNLRGLFITYTIRIPITPTFSIKYYRSIHSLNSLSQHELGKSLLVVNPFVVNEPKNSFITFGEEMKNERMGRNHWVYFQIMNSTESP